MIITENIKFHLWLGDEPIHREKDGALVGWHRPDHVWQQCQQWMDQGTSAIKQYTATHGGTEVCNGG